MDLSTIKIGSGTLLGIGVVAGLVYLYQDYSETKRHSDTGKFVDDMFRFASSDDDLDEDILRESRHTTGNYYGGRKTRKSKSTNRKTKRRK